MEPLEEKEVENSFMGSYSDAMSEQLKTTTLNKSFVRANQQAADKDEVITIPIFLLSLTFSVFLQSHCKILSLMCLPKIYVSYFFIPTCSII